jgi:hypothetical protein
MDTARKSEGRAMKALLAVVMSLGILAACGEKGPTGSQGPAGASGPAGPVGPAGSIGPAGPAGGGLYASRSDVYCDPPVVMPNDANVVTISATCRTALDLPLVGACSVSGGGATLQINRPNGWGTPGPAPAAWECGWTNTAIAPGGDILNVPGATATICCITHP